MVKLVVAQHVHHAHRREGHLGQVGALGHGGADQQAAVGAAGDGQAVVAGVALS